MKRGILFDLDGTLWDSSEEVVKAWNIALEKCKDIDKVITVRDMYNVMGRTMDAIAEALFGQVGKKRRNEILRLCCEEEDKYLSEHGAVLYPYLEETLEVLIENYGLFIVSNCQSGYIETFLKVHKMADYFKDIECWGNTGRPKGENIKHIIERNGLEQAIYVGDTIGDYHAAAFAGIPFVYARYGFGTVEEPDYIIDGLKELVTLSHRLFY